MKKLMFAAALAAIGTAFAVESGNVVGYMNKPKVSGYNFACYGSMFVTPGATSYSLADLSITGPATKAIARMNYIQFFASGTACKVDAKRAYYYFGGTWYQRGATATADSEIANPAEITMDAGVGFLACLPLATAKIAYAGEVISAAEQTLTLAKPAGVNFFVASNPSASDVTLSQITITGPTTKAIARMNYIQFFATGTACKVDPNRAYYYFGGVWYQRGATATADVAVADTSAVAIGAGEGFLVCFPLAAARLNFPTSL